MPAALLTIARQFVGNNAPSRPKLTGVPTFGGNLLGSEKFAANRPVLLDLFRGDGTVAAPIAGTVSVWGAILANPDMSNVAGPSGVAPPYCQKFTGDGVSVNYDTQIPFVAFSNNNWIVLVFRGDLANLAGTVTTTVGSTDITGAGTSFLANLFPGMTVKIGTELQTIAEVTSDLRASTVDPWQTASAGATMSCNVTPELAQTTDFTVVTNGGLGRITLTAAAKAPAGARMEVHFVKPQQLLADAAHATGEEVQIKSKSAVWLLAAGGVAITATTATLVPLGE